MTKSPAIIGTETSYHGTEHRYLKGYTVRVIGIIRGEEYLTTDDEIARSGGVRATDRVDVAPIMEGGRTSFASSDALAIDLACFRKVLAVN